MIKKGGTMKKSLYAILVVLLSSVGANSWADKIDHNVKRVTVETSDNTGNDNFGGKQCASKPGK